jgi:nucleotide-binding universal stress UspA family protein
MTAEPVVAATDGSQESLRAVEWAARQAVLHRVPLRIVSAASLPKMAMLQFKPERDAVLGFVREHRDRAMTAAAARAAEMAPGLLTGTDPLEGPAARAVTGSGSGALMLVVGSCGIGAFTAMVLGSVARYAADHASCPVVVVREETAAVPAGRHRRVHRDGAGVGRPVRGRSRVLPGDGGPRGDRGCAGWSASASATWTTAPTRSRSRSRRPRGARPA